MELAEVLVGWWSTYRVLQQSDAALQNPDPGLTAAFDSLIAQARADGGAMPNTEGLACWFGANPVAVLVFVVGALLTAAATACAMSAPAPCTAYSPEVRRPVPHSCGRPLTFRHVR